MSAASGGQRRLWVVLALCLLAGVGPAARHALAEDCAELIVDGGFEVGGAWDLGATLLPPLYVTYIKHSGNQSLALGITQGGNANSYSSARQFVFIPAGADRATLSFWFYAIVEAQPGADKMQLVLLNPDGSTEYVLWTARADSRTWNQLTFDVSRWRGRPLQVYFNVYNDGVGGTVGMFLDDVSLVACPGNATEVPATPSRTPSTAQPSKTPAPTRTPCGMVPPCATLPPPPPRSKPWAATATFESPTYPWNAPAWAADPTAYVEETVLTDAAPTPVLWTPAATASAAGTPTGRVSSSTPVVSRSATETPGLGGAGESGFTPEVTRISLALTAVPTPPTVRTGLPTIKPSNMTPASSAVQGSNEGRFVRWPRGWWWGVAAIGVIILGAWLLTKRLR